MNYLKAIANINDARDIVKSEQQYYKAKMDALHIIEKLADDMYAIELNKTQYVLWDAIKQIADSIKYQD